ncbi:MAG TPA: fumarylacetoacetase [Saprospiraceae bacterium]
MKSWIEIAEQSDFSIYNIPFGIGSTVSSPFVCTRIGEEVVNLYALAQTGFFEGLVKDIEVFNQNKLNPFIALGKSITNEVRLRLQETFSNANSPLKSLYGIISPFRSVSMHVPVEIGDYTDFYSSIEHATNVGKMFRDPENALLPNWRHIPIGYHGRASSIVISGTPIKRPKGQTKPADQDRPVFGPTKRLDFELEIGFVIGKETQLGDTISTDNAEDHIFGLVLFNDWSARDIQQWEYVPLGPFLAKNFASGISPWIVTLEALEPFKVKGPEQKPEVLPYLQYDGQKNYDIHLEVALTPADEEPVIISVSNFKYMYWNMCQQLAHHTSNGCNVRVGDLMASGTISGPSEGSLGSLLEISVGGKKPLTLPGGQTRTFVEDGDTITLTGWAEKDGHRVGFGEVFNTIESAL